VELLPSQVRGKRYEVKLTEGHPSWIRPVSGIKFGQIDESLVEDVRLLDIIKIDDITHCPDGFQTENVLFDPTKIEVVESIPSETRFLDKLITPVENSLFGNETNAVSPTEIIELKYSLTFIKPETWSCHEHTNIFGKKTRMKFMHNKIMYDLPITDENFCQTFEDCPTIVESFRNIYLAISLGKFFKGYYYKLVAGVIGCE
jgi:hypothetical protein